MHVTPYLVFPGTAQEALDLYKVAMDGELIMTQTYGEVESMGASDAWKQKLLHAEIRLGETVVFLSDNFEGAETPAGKNLGLNVEFDSEEAMRTAFQTLKEGGEVTMEVQHMFWGSIFGSVIDRFGVHWSLGYPIPAE